VDIDLSSFLLKEAMSFILAFFLCGAGWWLLVDGVCA
jgi:hypothetical protein